MRTALNATQWHSTALKGTSVHKTLSTANTTKRFKTGIHIPFSRKTTRLSCDHYKNSNEKMPKIGRYTIRQKKDYLMRYAAFQGTQREFCVQESLNEATMSKWVKGTSKILLTPDNSATVKRRTRYNNEKEQVMIWINERKVQGYQVCISDILHYAKNVVPNIFEASKSYNSEYVLCRRILVDSIQVQQKMEMKDVSNTMLAMLGQRILVDSLHVQQTVEMENVSNAPLATSVSSNIPADVSEEYEHGEVHRYVQCTKEQLKISDNYGYCHCKGKQIYSGTHSNTTDIPCSILWRRVFEQMHICGMYRQQLQCS